MLRQPTGCLSLTNTHTDDAVTIRSRSSAVRELHHRPGATERHPPERGLYVDDVTGPWGDTLVALVDRHGRAIVRVGVAYPEHLPLIERRLLELLEELDPEPTLRVL